jgi:murein DD-endopeptidase MepM/ murein hydrolase activator NlpD
MTPLLWLGAGGLTAYLLLRTKTAGAATPAPETPTSAGARPTQLPPGTGSPSIVVVNTPGPKPSTSPTPPQITVSAPPSAAEVMSNPQATVIRLSGRWGWPVPRYNGRAPVISDGFGSSRPSFPGGKHRGVDIMFGRIASDQFPIGPNGSKAFVMPDSWLAVAASDGVLWSAGYTPRGGSVVIDHGEVATFYTHLQTILFAETKPPAKGTPKELLPRVKAGQPLGVIGADPLDPSRLKHLHLELWLGGPSNAIDPAPLMKSWQVFAPSDLAPFLPSAPRNAAKKSAKRPDFVRVTGHERRWPGTALHPPR